MKSLVFSFFLFSFLISGVSIGQSESMVDIKDTTGKIISLDYTFVDYHGKEIVLSDFVGKIDKPILLSFNYYSCPNLCNASLDHFDYVARQANLSANKDMQVINISMKSNDSLESLKKFQDKMQLKGVSFFISPDNQVKKLANKVGFFYRKNQDNEDFSHLAAIYVLSQSKSKNDFKIHKIISGLGYDQWVLKKTILESKNELSAIEMVKVYCYSLVSIRDNENIAKARTSLKYLALFLIISIFGSIVYLLLKEKIKGV